MLGGQWARLWLSQDPQHLHDMGESCGKHRVARLMRLAGLRSHTGYERRPGRYGGRPAVVAPNLLERQFAPSGPNKSWVTDITFIRTHEGVPVRGAQSVFSPGCGLVDG